MAYYDRSNQRVKITTLRIPSIVVKCLKDLRGDRKMALWEVIDELLPMGSDNPFDCEEEEMPEDTEDED